MSPTLLTIVGLRAAAFALSTSGETKASNSLYGIADAVEAGQATDEHMALVAEKLKSRTLTQEDWEDVDRRIAADRETLHGQ